MLDDTKTDELFAVLARYVRLRERLAQQTVRTSDGVIETAAYKCLFHLVGNPMRSSQLAETVDADPSTISRHVASLVKLGYVRREADPHDGRATLLVATATGTERANHIKTHRRERLQALMTDWTNDELTTLVSLLDRFVSTAAELVVPPPCAADPAVQSRAESTTESQQS